ncbi:MAG: hypothetical protein U5K81_03405 [Trueperaceae bacterium]|nr:hypothetical protein [Trueperaceae bacterium]
MARGGLREAWRLGVRVLVKGGLHVLQQRFAGRARLLGAVHHRQHAGGVGQGGQQPRAVERAEQPHLEHADAFPACVGPRHRLVGGVGRRTHHDQDPIGIGGADVVERPVVPAGSGREGVHGLLDHVGQRAVEGLHALAGLEEHVRVLRRAAQHRPRGRERPGAEGPDVRHVDQRAQVVFADEVDAVHFVRGAEPVHHVHEGNATT